MLRWFGKRKREEQRLVETLHAIESVKAVARIKASLLTLDVDVSEAQKTSQVASSGATALLQAIVEKGTVAASQDDCNFVNGLMLMTFCNHISYILECSFEVSSTVALILHFGPEDSDTTAQVIASYNEMSGADSKVVRAIGNTCVKWCNEPSEMNLLRLGALRDTLLQQATLQ
jgi:hypothetical protein